MAQSRPTNLGAITLDQLILLNDEIAALVRAGVPLEPALAELGGDLPGRLGKIAIMLAERTSRGESLLEILSAESTRLPPVYRAVVEAGLRAGRLPKALEALAGSVRRLAETRRGLATATFYPLMVFVLAWAFFAFFSNKIAPFIMGTFQQLEFTGRGVFGWLTYWGQSAMYWGPMIPLVIIVLTGTWWYYCGRAGIAEPGRSPWLIAWLPWMGQSLRWTRAATFVDLLAMLVESGVPLHEGIVLAAEASGDHQIMPAARRLSAALKRGETLSRQSLAGAELPPLLCWLMAAGQRHGALLPALKHAAETYHRRARHQADIARVFLPVVATIVIGGSVTLLYTLALFAPYASLLKTLSGA